MQFRLNNSTGGGGRDLWPLLSLLLLAVIVPTVCVLWFMMQAAGNERMAVRQKLADLYGRELDAIRSKLDADWAERVQQLSEHEDEPAGRRFQQLVSGGVAESVLILDENRQSVYPGGSTARLAEPSAQLFALQSATNRSDSQWTAVLESLSAHLNDYSDPMPSAQRLFLMKEVEALGGPVSPTARAEELAAVCLERAEGKPRSSALTAAISNELWWIASPSGRTVGLYTRTHIAHISCSVAGVRVELSTAGPAGKAFLSQPAGSHLPGWELHLTLEGKDPFTAAAEKQVAVYLWTGLLVVVLIAVGAGLMGHHLIHQLRLNRLKNDFVATVSHELKTPLASMRVLVDTLIDGRQTDAGQAAEYLQLISKENERLSRLIDNFLTFSRMERNKRSFQFAEVNPDTIVRAAVDAVRERFEAADVKFEIASLPDLPLILVDKDAMVAVLINLLDNAFKYSMKDKHITLRTFAAGNEAYFEVKDKGIGISHRDTKKIWDRFYQVDPSLARRASGCGLGLSIVKFIVETHGGRVDVKSQIGQGSTFSVRIPCVEKPEK